MSKKRQTTTPHRLSRSSNIIPSPGQHHPIAIDKTPLDELLPSMIELNDNLVDLDSNMQQLQGIHESLISFNESFASFLYGMQVNAYTVEFNELPSFNELGNFKNDELRSKIAKLEEYFQGKEDRELENETYMTNDEDGSFIVQPSQRELRQEQEQRLRREQREPREPGEPREQLQRQGSKIPVGRRVTVAGNTGSLLKPTAASERRQRVALKKDTRPPFR